MAHAGGSTKCGGGAKCGGGPSLYEAWIETIWDLWGHSVFDRSRGDTTKNITKLISVMAGQFEGAEVDALRIRSEGLPGTAIEALPDWIDIYQIDRSDIGDDALRSMFRALMGNTCNVTSASRVEDVAEDIAGDAGSGMSTSCTAHAATMANCTTVNNGGDGCRYFATLVPSWMWQSEYRQFLYALQEWCDRSDAFYGETTACVENDSGTPVFYFGRSIVDRDVLSE